MPPSDDDLEVYLRQDRQWTRRCRIEHAEFLKRMAESESDRRFFQRIIDANTRN